MALDEEFFDSVSIDIVKKKYYNANKVRALLDDIRTQAAALNAENAELKRELEELSGKKADIGETLLSAQATARQIVEQANAKAEGIVAAAEKRRDELLAVSHGDGEAAEYAVRRVGECFDRLREHQLACIEELNSQWQEFLCGLMPDEDGGEDGSDAESGGGSGQPAPSSEDIEKRVSEIVKELQELSSEKNE